MKYTRSESGEVVEVKGCTSCPHVTSAKEDDGWTYMHCRVPVLQSNGTIRPRDKKLTTNWEGPYHATCPLASEAKNVPAFREETK